MAQAKKNTLQVDKAQQGNKANDNEEEGAMPGQVRSEDYKNIAAAVAIILKPMIQETFETATIEKLPLSLFIHLYRINSFAKILYPLQTIPMMIPTKDIDSLNRSLREFLWRGQKPRIALTKLWLYKEEGVLTSLILTYTTLHAC